MNAIQLVKRNPVAFSLNMQSGGIECRIILDKYHGLEIEISPEEVEESTSLFVDLQRWAGDNEAHLLLKTWGKIADKSIRNCIILFFFLAGTWLVVVDIPQNNSYALRVRDLLDAGITDANIIEAVELLLQIQVQTINFPNWFIILILVTIIVGAILPIRPKVVMGIGHGAKQLRAWKWWYRILQATIVLILTGFLVPYIFELAMHFLDG